MAPAGRCPAVPDGHARLPGVWSVDLTRGRRCSCPRNAFRRAPPQSNRNASELTFGYDFVNFNFGTESASALGSLVFAVPGRLITRIASSHGAQANWVAWIQSANGFACSRKRPKASNEGTARMLMEICSKLPATDR